MLETAYVRVRGQTTEYEVADVFRQYGEAYRQQYAVTPEQARVMGAIVACRTMTFNTYLPRTSFSSPRSSRWSFHKLPRCIRRGRREGWTLWKRSSMSKLANPLSNWSCK